MPYSDQLADRVRLVLANDTTITEKKMFGGLCFMRRGHMCCGIVDDRLMLRLDADLARAALDEPHTHPMDFTGRNIKSMLFVEPDGIANQRSLSRWVGRAVAYNDTQKAKPG